MSTITSAEAICAKIEKIGGKPAVAKAIAVATRAAILKNAEPDLDLSSLIVGLEIGIEGVIPDTLPVEILGLTNAIAIRLGQDMSGMETRHDSMP